MIESQTRNSPIKKWVVIAWSLASAHLLSSCFTSQTESPGAWPGYAPFITSPAYPKEQGPRIHLDEGHHNRHTYGGLGGFAAFRDVLNEDGYRVISFKDTFTPLRLQDMRILVIPLPQDERNLGPPWHNPTHSAFKQSEIVAVKHWVENGGSLFLIVDHHPFAGASEKLAREFGFSLFNGHAEDRGSENLDMFSRVEGTLSSNVITSGRDSTEKLDSIKSFGGAAIGIPEDATGILIFDGDWVQYLTETAWDFSGIEPVPIEGLSQGAYKRHGNGKIVVFGDGNMFSAQIDDDGEIAGFIDPEARQNFQLLLNVVHYLDGLLD